MGWGPALPATRAPSWLTVPGACVQLYGKAMVREGRKMGHVTRVFRDGLQ